MEFEHMLTKDVLKSMKDKEKPRDFVVQIVEIASYVVNGETKMCAIISDGINLHASVFAAHLNNLVFSGLLEPFGIIKINNYQIVHIIDYFESKTILTIKDVDALVPGKITRLVIGNPQPLTALFHQKSERRRPVIDLGNIRKLLTKGSLMSIMNNVVIKNPVVQILDFKLLHTRTNGVYHITISDGDNFTNITAMDTIVNNRGVSKLSQFCVIALNKYMVSDFFDDRARHVKRLSILEFDIIVCGNVMGSKVGNPRQINEREWNAYDDALRDALNVIERINNLNLN